MDKHKTLPCPKFRQNPDSALTETTIRKRQIQSWNIRSFMNQSEQQSGLPKQTKNPANQKIEQNSGSENQRDPTIQKARSTKRKK